MQVRFNLKNIIVGGLLMYVAMFVVSIVTGPLLHEGVLQPLYDRTASFWRPELMQDPPDMAAVMPRWITTGLLSTFILAGLYDNIRSAFDGSGVLKGVKYGVVVGLAYLSFSLGYSGVFNLPDAIWGWWTAEGFIYFIVGGAVLGWFIAKWGAD